MASAPSGRVKRHAALICELTGRSRLLARLVHVLPDFRILVADRFAHAHEALDGQTDRLTDAPNGPRGGRLRSRRLTFRRGAAAAAATAAMMDERRNLQWGEQKRSTGVKNVTKRFRDRADSGWCGANCSLNAAQKCNR